MTIREALNQGEKRLRAVPDPRLDAEYLLAEVLRAPRLSILLEKMRELTEEEYAAFDALLSRREKREPLQYILGSQSFMGFLFQTDARALIPRNDTEALCEEALRYLAPGKRALDLCTGSGALAVSIKKLCPRVEVYASDVSEAALSLASENAARLSADVHFVQGDLFAPLAGEKFHVIVSNPPYIPEFLRGHMQAEVEKEPDIALFAGADGLDFYRRIALEAPRYLEENGQLCLEIGDDQYDAVAALLEKDFCDVHLVRDMNGRSRVVSGRNRGALPHAPAGE
ncbi:MAG: peptide chain release factor N(5)-glutamine methyltransferase [Clostridiales bacterium]|nr:peptide chain release factor N(5)-glutamine methyltransferase [Clostridiales bacterium]